MDKTFISSNSLEENPFEDEKPAETFYYDLSGNEVKPDENE